MEEKEVTMSGQQAQDKTEKEEKFDINKVSREELINVITQLNQQLQMAARQNEELKMRIGQINGIETRLHYLFKVLEFRNAFNDPDFIVTICDEIKDIMTVREELEPKEETKE